jgi:hypothetical protein
MTKLLKRFLLSAVILAAAVYGCWSYVHDREQAYIFHYTEGLPFNPPITTQDGAYSAQAFYITWGGAAGGVSMYVNVTDHRQQDSLRTVYYADTHTEPNISWTDNHTLLIENHDEYNNFDATADVSTDVYDSSGRACLASAIQTSYRCYEVFPEENTLMLSDGKPHRSISTRILMMLFS